jgi:hypothetical protein
MHHAIHRVRHVEVVRPYVLRLTFADAVEQTIDLEPILAGEIFGALRDPELFRQVRVDPEVHTIVWPNGADFDPATLHDWPEHAAAFARKAEEWARSAEASASHR